MQPIYIFVQNHTPSSLILPTFIIRFTSFIAVNKGALVGGAVGGVVLIIIIVVVTGLTFWQLS